MYSRYLFYIALVYLGLTIGAIKAVNYMGKSFTQMGKVQENIPLHGSTVLYLQPPIVERAILKASYLYSSWLWDQLKQKIVPGGYLVEGINGRKIIKYRLELNQSLGSQYPMVTIVCDTDGHKDLSYCENLTRYYIKLYRAFYFNFTNRSYFLDQNHGFVSLLYQLIDTAISNTLQKMIDEFPSLALVHVNVNRIEIIFLNQSKDLHQHSYIKFLVLVELKIDDQGYTYYLRLPYLVTLDFYVDGGDVNNPANPSFASSHVLATKVVTKTVTIPESTCDPGSLENILLNNCQYVGSYKVTQSWCVAQGQCCCEYNGSTCIRYCTNYVKQTSTRYCPKYETTGQGTFQRYTKLKETKVVVARAGYIGLHYIYRISITVQYLYNLSGVLFRAQNIQPVESITFTPFARYTGAYNNTWQPYDPDVNGLCFAFSIDQGSAPSTSTGSIPGIPYGQGYCNGKVYYINGQLRCNDISFGNYFVGVCGCGVYDEYPVVCGKKLCKGYIGYVASKSCEKPVTASIFRTLRSQQLNVDLIDVFDPQGPGHR